MAEAKRTQVDVLNDILKVEGLTDEMKELIGKEIAKREKKKSGEKKPTKEQIEAKGEADAIYDAMEEGKWYSISELMKLVGSDSCQKITNRMLALKTANLVENEKQKGKSVYRKVVVATADEDEVEG